MSQENVEMVRAGWERYSGTGEPPWDLFDEAVEVHDHDTPDQGDYRGHEGMARWLEDWGAAWAEWSIDADEFIDAGDSVVVLVRMNTEGRGSGIKAQRLDALVYGIAQGLITRVDYYNDRQQALKAVGLAE
jgi:ketosteroid isomerase-like protein